METRDKKILAMKLLCFVLILVHTSCQSSPSPTLSQSTENKNQALVNDSIEIQFNQFKKLVLEGKKEGVKVFFEFPIKSVDLWYKVLTDDEIERANTDSPFNEKDFTTYFDRLFTKIFKECLSTINSRQLFDIGKYSTNFIGFEEKNFTGKSQIKATYSSNELRLTVNTIIRDKSDKVQTEHTEIYIFKIIDKRLKFAAFFMAG